MSSKKKPVKVGTKKCLKVAVLGPKGQCGSCVVDELLMRGHFVVGISRNPPKTVQGKGEYTSKAVDYNDVNALAKAMSDDYDAIVCAYGPPLEDMHLTYIYGVETHCKIKQALLQSSHSGPFIVIG